MRIGIVSAFGKESKPLRSKLPESRREVIDDLVFFLHRYENTEVVVVKTGPGQECGAKGTELLIGHYGPQVIINCGVAGAIAPPRQIGDVVISDRVITFSEAEGDWSNEGYSFAHPELLLTALQTAAGFHPKVNVTAGTILSGNDVICSLEKRESLWVRFRGQCVEQEGASVARVCQSHHLPWIIIRGISDRADEHLLHDFKKNVEQAALHSALVTFDLLKQLSTYSSFGSQ